MVRRALRWVSEQGDAALALVLALAVAVLGTFGVVDAEIVSGAILATLAILAFGMLRDRARQRAAEELLATTSGALAQLPVRLDSLAAVNSFIDASRQALEEASAIRVLVGDETGAALAAAREHTDVWYFRGGTGTFTRAVTLPECVSRARSRRRELDVQLEILDPSDEAVCERYARFRYSLGRSSVVTGEPWTADRTRIESYATILAACWHRQQYQLLKMRVALSDRVTTLRFDLSSSSLVITQDDPRYPALQISSGKSFYNFFRTELGSSYDQARRVPIDTSAAVHLDDEPTPDQVRALFAAVRVDLPGSYGDSELTKIIQKALHAGNPYA